jgi:hypothetical protein
MISPASSCASLDAMRTTLLSLAPEARFATKRQIRRILRQRRGLGLSGFHLPHSHILVLSESEAQACLPALLNSSSAPIQPPQFLITEPDPDLFRRALPGEPERWLWRRLVHGRVDLHLARRIQQGDLHIGHVRSLIARIGAPAFEEIAAVLHHDQMLLEPDSPVAVLAEALAFLAELHTCEPHSIPFVFPALTDPELLLGSLLTEQQLDLAELVLRSRPCGAPAQDPRAIPLQPLEPDPQLSRSSSRPISDSSSSSEEETAYPRSARVAERLNQVAHRAQENGNLVRAALLYSRAAALSTPALAGQARARAAAALETLIQGGLKDALQLDPSELKRWSAALMPILHLAPGRRWSREARLLYDLQKLASDHSRSIEALAPIAWLASLGRRSLRRPLPNQKSVRIARHLQSARRHLPHTRLPSPDRNRMASVLDAAISRAERSLRDRIRPLIRRALERVGFAPASRLDHVAFESITEDLLDRLAQRGHLTFGDVRDTLARNQLKLPDIQSPSDWLCRDRSLRANRQLAVSLQGVYRPAESYLRAIQHASALAFATPLGRWLTLWIALPFGGAFVALEGIEHILAWFTPGASSHEHATAHHDQASAHHGPHLVAPLPILLLGVMVALLIHFPAFRSLCGRGYRLLERGLRFVALTLPKRILEWPPLRFWLSSPLGRFLYDWLIRPVIPIIPLIAVLALFDHDPGHLALMSALWWFVAAIVLHTEPGRIAEEYAAESLAWAGHRLGLDLIPALYAAIMDLFHRALEGIEQTIYEVDQFLRFRSGESRLTLALKAFFSTLWNALTYVVRFLVNLVAEPQLNPIKHFPVVTVSHKLVAPFMLPLLSPPFAGLPPAIALPLGIALQFIVPGICGFLVWELKENWKLYAANRPRHLPPEIIGHHGETMRRLLLPGFHSGTIPHLFKRIRRKETRKREEPYRHASSLKFRHELQHIEHAVARTIARHALALAHRTPSLQPLEINLQSISIATNSISILLAARPAPGLPHVPLLTYVINRRGPWLLARILPHAPCAGLPAETQAALAALLAGLTGICHIAWLGPPLEEADLPDFLLTEPSVLVLHPPRPEDSPPTVLVQGRGISAAAPIPYPFWSGLWTADTTPANFAPASDILSWIGDPDRAVAPRVQDLSTTTH